MNVNLSDMESTLKSGDKESKRELLTTLYEMFQIYYLYVENRIQIIQMVLDYVIVEEDPEILDLAFRVLDMGVCSPMMADEDESLLNYEKIANALGTVEDPIMIGELIGVLMFSHDKRYADCILKFADSEDPIIKDAVQDAILEMQL